MAETQRKPLPRKTEWQFCTCSHIVTSGEPCKTPQSYQTWQLNSTSLFYFLWRNIAYNLCHSKLIPFVSVRRNMSCTMRNKVSYHFWRANSSPEIRSRDEMLWLKCSETYLRFWESEQINLSELTQIFLLSLRKQTEKIRKQHLKYFA